MGKEKSKKRISVRHRPAHLAHVIESEAPPIETAAPASIFEQVFPLLVPIIGTHGLLQLKSPNPSDREFACSGIANALLDKTNVANLLSKGISHTLLQLFGDPELAVRVESAGALR